MTTSTRPQSERGLPGLVHFYLEDHTTKLGIAVDLALLALNVVFLAVFVLETYDLGPRIQALLLSTEIVIAVIFLVEYVLRLYGAEDTLDEFLDPYTMVDLIAILPTLAAFGIPWVSPTLANVGFLRVVRVLRVLRFYRFTQDEEFFFGTVEEGTLRAGKLLLTVLSLFYMVAGVFYTVEHRVNPDVATFGDAFYYTVVTLTTTGFGDIVPVTRAGRWVAILGILAAIILIPWQASRIVREWAGRDKVDVTCPNCGLSEHDADASHCKACGHVIYQEYGGDDE